jgi:dihydrofolate synthase / folylpolyglutamate synthase
MTTRPTHTDCLNTLFGLRRFGIKLGLATIRRILVNLGNPHRLYRTVHVAGTNGKGSVASGIASVLRASGYRVGLYTSPHLVRFNERIQVDGAEITDADIVRLYRRVKRALPGGREPTFFEFTTAMALDEFARRKVDWAVIETGMGGRMDATNVVAPAVTVVTNVSLEHREYLGPTLAAIASEKAGIIKRRTPVVTGVRQPSALAVIRRAAGMKSAPLYCLGKEFSCRRTGPQQFNYSGLSHRWSDLATSLQGSYQVGNAALVLAACELLQPKAPRIDLERIRIGLAAHRWPGRLEVVCTTPLVMVDGAHNLDAARQLARHLTRDLAGRKLTLVVGILDDKPYRAMLRLLLPLAERVIATQAKINRALPAATIAAFAKTIVPDVTVEPDVAAALRQAMRTAAPGSLTLAAGSLYVVGEVKAALAQTAVQPG